jgi:hypothetical protein
VSVHPEHVPRASMDELSVASSLRSGAPSMCLEGFGPDLDHNVSGLEGGGATGLPPKSGKSFSKKMVKGLLGSFTRAIGMSGSAGGAGSTQVDLPAARLSAS